MTTQPIRGRRLAAVSAFALLVLALATFAAFTVGNVAPFVGGLVGVSLLAVGGWEVVSRRGAGRTIGLVTAAAGLVTVTGAAVVAEQWWSLVLTVLLVAASTACARFALSVPKAGVAVVAETAAPPLRHPVLIMNLKSGGGKAERFELERLCCERGIEPIVLRPGLDLVELAEDAVARGADCLGMAGGDGSQALVASVASAHGLPHVVIPAGTRNHFALDLGLNRDDVVGALEAYFDGFERVIDLAQVNGRVFVNNASMGVYAKVVQSGEYRDAKVKTTATMLPDILGPNAEPLDLRHSLPTGEELTTAVLILVSNNPYELQRLRGVGTRERIDTGRLGVTSLQVSGAADAQRLVTREAVGKVQSYRGWNEWSAPTFEVRSGGPVEIGVDGEALTLEPPLRFECLPQALTVRLPRQRTGLSPSASAVHMFDRASWRRLVDVARGGAW